MKKTGRFDSSNIAVEFKRTELGDVRLSRRLTAMAVALGRDPSASLPDVFGDSAGIEGCDRFLRNDKVSFDRVLRPHQQQTDQLVGSIRANGMDATALAISRTKLPIGTSHGGL